MINTINLPDLNTNPNSTIPTIIGTKSYFFNYRWINDYCLLDIVLNGEYLVKGRAMVTASDFIGRVKDSEKITGSLHLVNKFGNKAEPTQDNFHTDYYLVWGE